MVRMIAGLALALALVGAADARTDSDVALGAGATALHGSLMRPDGPARTVAVLIISGSGPTDRNGDSTVPGVKPATLRLLAERLADDGVISLRYDKRGVAASAAAGGLEQDLRFTGYIDDAVAWAERLRTEPGVKCVVILGHSEGALIAAVAAHRTPVCGVISVAGAGRPADEVLAEQLSRQAPADLMIRIRVVLAELKAGRTVPDAPVPALFRPSIQPYLISWLQYDPAAELKKLKAPVMILQGENDLQVSVADARRLATARPDARLVLLPGVNHVLKTAPADPAGNIAAYADPTLPLGPGVAEAVVGFVNGLEPRH